MLLDIVTPIVASAYRNSYVTVYFARAYDLKVGSIGDRLRTVKPTMFLGVPRVWEKISEKMKAIGATTTGLKKKIATWAKGKGLAYQNNMQLGGSGSKPWCYGLADTLVLSKVKKHLGLRTASSDLRALHLSQKPRLSTLVRLESTLTKCTV